MIAKLKSLGHRSLDLSRRLLALGRSQAWGHRTVALGAVAAALALITLWQLLADASAWDPGQQISELPKQVAFRAEEAGTAPPLDRFAEVVERPLFNSSRRPAPKPEAKPPPPPKPTPPPPKPAPRVVSRPFEKFQLVGIILAPGENSALFVEKGGGRTVRVLEGEYLEDWRLESVQEDQVVLRLDGIVKEIGFAKTDDTPAQAQQRRTARRRGQ